MKVRIIQEPEYMINYTVQTKRWWSVTWKTAYFGRLEQCEKVFDALVKTGSIYTTVKEYP